MRSAVGSGVWNWCLFEFYLYSVFIPNLRLLAQYELNIWLIDLSPGAVLAAMVKNSSLMICLSCQMLGQEVPQPEEPITNQALLMGLARIFLHPLASLLLSPYITEACLVPFLEGLCNLSSVSGRFKNKTPSGKKRRLMLFLDMMWAFLEVSCFVYCSFLKVEV